MVKSTHGSQYLDAIAVELGDLSRGVQMAEYIEHRVITGVAAQIDIIVCI